MEQQIQAEQQIQLDQALGNIQKLVDNIEKVIRGKRAQIQFILTALLAKGHILMEDVPGTGKTVMAKTLAQSIAGRGEHTGVNFKRIQFTPDLLPMDLIGSHIFDDIQKEFIFKKGPLFCNVLLADEINRASPKVQSALLECMAENQITIGETTYKLENLFFTIATHLQHIEQVLSIDEILFLQNETEKVYMHDELIKSVRNIVRATRKHPDIVLGASTRSGITFLKCLKSFALVNGRSFVTEEDLQQLTHAVLDHRMIYRSKEGKQKALPGILDKEMDKLSKMKVAVS